MQQSSVEKENGSGNEVMSAQQAEDLKMKEKRKREREVIFVLVFFFFFCNLMLLFSDSKKLF